MSKTTMRSLKSIHGFTMIEVLISIIVIAFGLLGIAGLQAFALKNNQSAGQRMTTTMLANDMAERVWSSNTTTRPLYSSVSPALNSNCLTVTGCTAAQLVGNDLAEWQLSLQRSLPNGQGVVCFDTTPDDGASAASPACTPGPGAPMVVKIWWLDDRSAAVSTTQPLQRFTWSFEP